MGEVQRRSHPTIMSGEVVVFAAGFETQPGTLRDERGDSAVDLACVLDIRAEVQNAA